MIVTRDVVGQKLEGDPSERAESNRFKFHVGLQLTASSPHRGCRGLIEAFTI